MANPHRGEAEVELGGAKFTLRYDFNALAELEGILGESVTYVMAGADKRIGLRFIRAAVYAGLLYDRKLSKGMTLEKIGHLLSPDNLAEVGEQVCRGIGAAFGVDLDEDAESGDSAGDPTAAA